VATVDLIVALGLVAAGWIGGVRLLGHGRTEAESRSAEARIGLHAAAVLDNRRSDTFRQPGGPLNERRADRPIR
jgi:hypothetical protein